MASASNLRMSREDFRKAKELEELRKTGSAPPATDEDGKMINPHIPQYISNAPWYDASVPCHYPRLPAPPASLPLCRR
jgi:hypothetical protein